MSAAKPAQAGQQAAGTNGPWRAICTGTESAPDWIVLGADDQAVAGFPEVTEANAARVAADARLIAAAPMLLAMVRAMIPTCCDPMIETDARQLIDGHDLPDIAPMPLDLLDYLIEYADVYATQNNETADSDCRQHVRAARQIFATARR